MTTMGHNGYYFKTKCVIYKKRKVFQVRRVPHIPPKLINVGARTAKIKWLEGNRGAFVVFAKL